MHARITPLFLLALVFAVPAAAVQKKPAEAHHAAADSGPKEIGSYDAWTAATFDEGGHKVCYALTRVQSSTPTLPGRGEVVLTVTERPAVRDTVAVTAGYTFPPKASVTMQVDQTGIDFFTRERDAYARDGKAAVAAFQRGDRAILRSPGPKDQHVTDTFSLKGFSAAYAAVVKACPEKK